MHIVVLVTAKDQVEAQKIADVLVGQKIAVCVNIVEKIDSIFRWQGAVDRAQESLLIIKSRKDLFPQIESAVKSVHSYETPEIIAIDISAGSGAYLKWIDDNCSKELK